MSFQQAVSEVIKRFYVNNKDKSLYYYAVQVAEETGFVVSQIEWAAISEVTEMNQ